MGETGSTFTATSSPSNAPVNVVETGSSHDTGRNAARGIGLCLSGGGYRAMLFHVGSLWRLHKAGILKGVDRISSVSGGSITAAQLGLRWTRIYGPNGSGDFETEVVNPIRGMACRTIDANSIIGGIFLPGTIGEKIAGAYEKHLFGEATLQDLPSDEEGPRFVINATNVQSGVLVRFSKPFMADYRVGMYPNPVVPLATAVAASSAFPPVLSPMKVELPLGAMRPREGNDLHYAPYTTELVLSDGGVYDNLGLETVWKRFGTVLVSDGGGQMGPEAEPKEDWARHSYRVLNLVDNQVRSLRKRQLLDSLVKGACDAADPDGRQGAYWGIRSDIEDFELDTAIPVPFEQSLKLAKTPTRLKRLDDDVQERLIDWGYAVCDAAIRKHLDPELPQPARTPYGHFPT